MKKYAKYFLLVLFFIILIPLSINYYVEYRSNTYILEKTLIPESDAIIVLGAYVYPNGQVSPMLMDRLDYGFDLYQQGKAKKIIVSGDHGAIEYDEVNTMRKYLMKKGVSRQDIFMDHAGFDTYDSLYRARDIFKVNKIIIVTQSFHLKRAIYIARELNIEAYGVASDVYDYPGMAYYKMRELGARSKAFWQAGIVKPEPKYLGKAIPIWGNGSLTDDGL